MLFDGVAFQKAQVQLQGRRTCTRTHTRTGHTPTRCVVHNVVDCTSVLCRFFFFFILRFTLIHPESGRFTSIPTKTDAETANTNRFQPKQAPIRPKHKDISLISLKKGIKCYLFCPKRTQANFVPLKSCRPWLSPSKRWISNNHVLYFSKSNEREREREREKFPLHNYFSVQSILLQ